MRWFDRYFCCASCILAYSMSIIFIKSIFMKNTYLPTFQIGEGGNFNIFSTEKTIKIDSDRNICICIFFFSPDFAETQWTKTLCPLSQLFCLFFFISKANPSNNYVSILTLSMISRPRRKRGCWTRICGRKNPAKHFFVYCYYYYYFFFCEWNLIVKKKKKSSKSRGI